MATYPPDCFLIIRLRSAYPAREYIAACAEGSVNTKPIGRLVPLHKSPVYNYGIFVYNACLLLFFIMI